MKLDRNKNPDGRGKYALLKLRRQEKPLTPECIAAADTLKDAGLLEFGTEPAGQFFVIKYKDAFAESALRAYALAVRTHASGYPVGDVDRMYWNEYSEEIEREADLCSRYVKKLPT